MPACQTAQEGAGHDHLRVLRAGLSPRPLPRPRKPLSSTYLYASFFRFTLVTLHIVWYRVRCIRSVHYFRAYTLVYDYGVLSTLRL